ncbi:MAG: hypothetical protein ACPHZ5_05345 [Candidatus Puniceispirillum sp.]
MMAKQKNIEVIAVNLPAGEEELLTAATHYFADRLLTPKQQKTIMLLIDVANCPIRVPLTRDMLSEKPGILGSSLPSVFEMSVSTAAGIKDALEVIAHEMVHVSQVLNRRLRMRPCKVKADKTIRMSHAANWLGDKFPALDEISWHLRPWEIEACQWQTILANEFIERMTGANPQIVTQRGRNNQLALLNVRPSAIKAPPQSPSLSMLSTKEEPVLPIFDPHPSALFGESKAASIDDKKDIERSNTADFDAQTAETDHDSEQNSAKLSDQISADAAETISDEANLNGDDKIKQSSHRVYQMVGGIMNGHHGAHHTIAQNGDDHRQSNGVAHAASNDGENTAIQIRIDGLEAPRLLSRGALSSKLDDLLARGLIAPEDAKAAQTSLTSGDD